MCGLNFIFKKWKKKIYNTFIFLKCITKSTIEFIKEFSCHIFFDRSSTFYYDRLLFIHDVYSSKCMDFVFKKWKKREFTTKIGAGGAVALCSHIKYCVIHTNCILECINMYQFLQNTLRSKASLSLLYIQLQGMVAHFRWCNNTIFYSYRGFLKYFCLIFKRFCLSSDFCNVTVHCFSYFLTRVCKSFCPMYM